MLAYDLGLALRSVRRDFALTLLIIAAVGAGVGASMTLFAVLRAMSGDPLPQKSNQLYAPQIGDPGPQAADAPLPDQLSYPDAMALMHERRAARQTAMYAVQFSVFPSRPDGIPFLATGRAVHADFFRMFDAPFLAGAPWGGADDRQGENVVVIGSALADRLFPGETAVGKTVNLDHAEFRVVGVLKPWNLQPRVYDVTAHVYAQTEDVFLPFQAAINRLMPSQGATYCSGPPNPNDGPLTSSCRWLQYWVELPTLAEARAYREFLRNYASEVQRRTGARQAPRVDLPDARRWLVLEKIVPPEVRLSTLIAFGFLAVCLVNGVGLMLAKFSSQVGELSVRRALGASKRHVFFQCLTETALVGALGGLLGIGLTVLGLRFERAILREDYARLAHLDSGMVVIILAVAVLATVCSGFYPAWQASRIQPALALKAH